MLNPKQKAYLKSLAHSLKPTFQIGKDGLNENMLNDILNYLNKHELMKVSILQNSFVTFDEAEAFFEMAGIEFVQSIGRTMVLYKHSDNAKNRIVIPVKK